MTRWKQGRQERETKDVGQSAQILRGVLRTFLMPSLYFSFLRVRKILALERSIAVLGDGQSAGRAQGRSVPSSFGTKESKVRRVPEALCTHVRALVCIGRQALAVLSSLQASHRLPRPRRWRISWPNSVPRKPGACMPTRTVSSRYLGKVPRRHFTRAKRTLNFHTEPLNDEIT